MLTFTITLDSLAFYIAAEVNVACLRLTENKRFLALIESQVLKRFGYSNITENNLVNYIFKITDHAVKKIYWRFPVQLTQEVVLGLDGTWLR